MSRSTINVLLMIALGAVIVITIVTRRDYTQRNTEFLPGMVNSVAYDAFTPNPVFGDGKTLQALPAGTIARGFAPMHYQATPEDALRAGQELHSPLNPADSAADLARGVTVFKNICSPCHGNTAMGDGTVTKRGFPPPPSLMADRAMTMADGQMFHIITYGQNNMPPLTAQISRRDRWCAILHVRALQAKQAAPVAAAPVTAQATKP